MLEDHPDLLLQSMVDRDPSKLPLADRYAATENSVAGALTMMSFWRTVTGVNRVGQYIVDEPAGSNFVTANLDEGGSSTAFWGRLLVVDDRLTELELYNARSASDCGFVLHADDIATFPSGWTSPIPEGQRASGRSCSSSGRSSSTAAFPRPRPRRTSPSWRPAGSSMRAPSKPT
jgi:hypothetical protein